MATGSESASNGPTPVAVQLQILASEHANLATTRAMVWGEVFSRSAMYLTTLSGAIVALALVGQGAGFNDEFANFAILVLPLVLFVGIATGLRLNTSNVIDAMCVMGMNRVRAKYLELAPELEPVFTMGATDDFTGVAKTMGTARGGLAFVHFISATPIIILTINSVVLATFVSLVVGRFGVDLPVLVAVGLLVFVVAIAAQLRIGQGFVRKQQESYVPHFPSPTPARTSAAEATAPVTPRANRTP